MKAVRETIPLVFFFSDNGGQIYNGADNTPLRDKKGTTFEGGVRVPFLVSWPKQIPPDRITTRLSAHLMFSPHPWHVPGFLYPLTRPYDGVDLIPFLRGEKQGNPHERLFWRELEVGQWGVRDGDWKLVRRTIDLRQPGGKNMVFPEPSAQIFNLSEDIGEKLEFSNDQPDKVTKLRALLDEWETQAARKINPNAEKN